MILEPVTLAYDGSHWTVEVFNRPLIDPLNCKPWQFQTQQSAWHAGWNRLAGCMYARRLIAAQNRKALP